MPKRIPEENQRRFAELLEACLTKSGRKRSELARACHWDASMITKILKLQARPGLAIFLQFMAPFLIANGGMAHARQVLEMADLLGGELDETDLNTIATAAERQPDSFQSRSYIRDRANTFRQTIAAALNEWASVMATSTELTPRTQFGLQPALAITTEPETSEVESESSATEPDSVEVAPPQDWPRILADWQAMVREFPPLARSDLLEPDEVIAAVLDWENQLTDPAQAGMMWNWLGKHLEELRQKARLELVLRRFDGQRSWNQLEWEWLDWVTAETARRNSGQAQLSPRQMASFIADLGQIAFEAVKHNDGQTVPLTINLNEARPTLPVTQSATWDWLRRVAELGPVRLVVTDVACQFVSRDEAEFLAAQYLLEVGSDADIQRMVKNAGRPFGILRQMVRILHFTGKDESVYAIVDSLLEISDVIPLRYLDAAELLAACDAVDSRALYPLWAQVEAFLCDSWVDADAPEYRAAIVRVMGEMRSGRLLALLRHTLLTESQSELHRRSVINAFAEMGGPQAVESLFTLADQGVWREVLAGSGSLPATDAAELLIRLALRADIDYAEQCAAVSALAQAGTIPARRALQHIASVAAYPKTRRYAETRLDLLYSPAQAALVASELDMARPADDTLAFHGLLQQAKALLHHSVWLKKDEAGQVTAGNPLRTLSRALARVWAKLDIDKSFRVEAALSLTSTQAWPAFEICLETLPLVDHPDRDRAGLIERLLISLAPKAAPWLWKLLPALLDKAATPAQGAVIIRCLGRASGMALNERFEHLLTHPEETIAIAAIEALADSVGQTAGNRLWQIAEADQRPDVRAAAWESLAVIGSERALPYLSEKLASPASHTEACFQLARLHHPETEQLLAQTALAATDESRHYSLYLPALAISGGAIAVQAIYDLVGPQPDELTLVHLRDQFAADTVARATAVWLKLAYHPSSDWRMLAGEVLARDTTQTLIEQVVRLALEDPDPRVRESAQGGLRWHAPTIASESATGYILDRLEEQVGNFRIADEYLLKLLQKCLSGLANGEKHLPAEIGHRTLTLLWPVLSRARPTDEALIRLLAVFAYPEFVEAAGNVARLLEQAVEASVQRRALETLIAMRAPGLFEALVSSARSSLWPEVREQAGLYLAEAADFGSLLSLPNELKSVLYRAAVRRDFRLQRELFREKAILANGQGMWI